MIYTPLNKDWYYTYLDIPDLDTIKQELLMLFSTTTKKMVRNAGYVNIFRNNIVNCPTFMSYLASKGLDKKLNRIMYTEGLLAPNPHVDSGNPNNCTYSLNIPLVDAEDSYTAWYATDKTHLLDRSNLGHNPEHTVGWVDIEDATEVARLQYTQPALVNTTILHRGLVDRPSRILCCIRFWPELTAREVSRLTGPKDSNAL
jgi:hypothetical protein